MPSHRPGQRPDTDHLAIDLHDLCDGARRPLADDEPSPLFHERRVACLVEEGPGSPDSSSLLRSTTRSTGSMSSGT